MTYKYVNYLWNDAEAPSSILSPGSSTAPTSSAAISASPTPAAATRPPSSPRKIRSPARRSKSCGSRVPAATCAPAQARELLFALPAEAARSSEALRSRERQGAEVARRGRDGGDVQPCHLQPQPARVAPSTRRCTRFIPGKHVDHTHPNAVIAVAASASSMKLTKEIYGDEVVYTPWLRPGFELGLAMQEIVQEEPQGARHHDGPARPHQLGRRRQGLLSPDARPDREGRAVHRGEIRRPKAATPTAFGGAKYTDARPTTAAAQVFAPILPWLRGQVSQQKRFIGTVQDDEKILRFVNSKDAPRLAELGTSCPDHFLRTKIKPLYVPIGIRRPRRSSAVVASRNSPTASSNTARTTPIITTAANRRTRPRCATRTRPSSSSPASA